MEESKEPVVQRQNPILSKVKVYVDLAAQQRNLIAICCGAAFAAFLFFWFLHWVFSASSDIIDNNSKETWHEGQLKAMIGNIRVGLRIMPSANTENNMIMMSYIKNTEEEDDAGNVDKSYHSFHNTLTYFPSLTLKEDYVPFGEPEPFWFHLSWAPLTMSKMPDQYEAMGGLNKWSLVTKGHRIWNQNDPKFGIDVKMWREDVYSFEDCGEMEYCKQKCENSYNGIFKNSYWYSYYIANKIWFKVNRESYYSGSIESWNITGGWYKNGAYIDMVKADPGVEYLFDNIPIEVRAYNDPFAGNTEEEEKEAKDPSRTKSTFTFWKLLMWLSFIAFLFFLIWLAAPFAFNFINKFMNPEENRRLIDSQK